jgi:MFS family permease
VPGPGSPQLKARLRPLYAAAFLQGLVLWYPVEKLFMTENLGLSAFQVTAVTSAYVAVMFCADVPVGIIADRWSRKGVLMAATGALTAASLVCGLADGFASYLAGLAIWGIFYAAYNGTYSAAVLDVLEEVTGSRDGFGAVYGRITMLNALAYTAGALASAVITRWSPLPLRAQFLLTAPVTCTAPARPPA